VVINGVLVAVSAQVTKKYRGNMHRKNLHLSAQNVVFLKYILLRQKVYFARSNIVKVPNNMLKNGKIVNTGYDEAGLFDTYDEAWILKHQSCSVSCALHD